MRKIFSIRGMLMPLAFAALLPGACVTDPARPLMSPWDKDAGFGYSEQRVDKSRIAVTYVGPFMRTRLNPADRAGEVKRLRAQAEDLAVWRAADIAKAKNYPALEIVERRSEVSIENYDDNPRIIRYGLAHGQSGFRYDQTRSPGFRSAWIQAKAVVTVILKRQRGEKDLDAAATADRFAGKYQGARTLPAY
jgi:hypothetical protein